MKTISVPLNTETAKRVLADVEKEISEKMQSRDKLNIEISQLSDGARAIREQLQGINGATTRARRGDNTKRIEAYLKTLPDNKGSRMSQICKATGIGASSASFTLGHNKKLFTKDENGLWTLK